MLKVTKHIVKCDLVKGFNQPIMSGLVRGLLMIPLDVTLIKGFTNDC